MTVDGGVPRPVTADAPATPDAPGPAPVRRVPDATVARLAVYLRVLTEMLARGVRTVSSEELAEAAGVNAAKLRKDLSHIGSYGVRGVGYDVSRLTAQIEDVLGLTRSHAVVLVGMGNLGHALAGYGGFAARGFRVVGLFDADPALVGTVDRRAGGAAVADELPRDRRRARGDDRRDRHPGRRGPGGLRPVGRAGVTSILNFAPLCSRCRMGRRPQGRPGGGAADPRLPRAAQGWRPAEPTRDVGRASREASDEAAGRRACPTALRRVSCWSGSRSPEDAAKLVDELVAGDHVSEAAVLATCNRVEIYAAVDAFHGGVSRGHPPCWPATPGSPSPSSAATSTSTRPGRGRAPVRRRGRAGLMVVGEAQILGQLRAASAARSGLRTVGPSLHAVLQQALRVGKRVQSETAVGRGRRLLVSVALDRAAALGGARRARGRSSSARVRWPGSPPPSCAAGEPARSRSPTAASSARPTGRPVPRGGAGAGRCWRAPPRWPPPTSWSAVPAPRPRRRPRHGPGRAAPRGGRPLVILRPRPAARRRPRVGGPAGSDGRRPGALGDACRDRAGARTSTAPARSCRPRWPRLPRPRGAAAVTRPWSRCGRWRPTSSRPSWCGSTAAARTCEATTAAEVATDRPPGRRQAAAPADRAGERTRRRPPAGRLRRGAAGSCSRWIRSRQPP